MATTKNKQLPGTLTMRTEDGDCSVRVVELDAVGTPDENPENIGAGPEEFDGWRHQDVSEHLRTWTPGEDAKSVMRQVEEAVERGLPDARRRPVRNLRDGIFDERWLPEIAMGQEIEAPYWKWSKRSSGVKTVAVCLDATAPGFTPKQTITNRMNVAMGIGAALEAAGYPIQIVGGTLRCQLGGKPRRNNTTRALLVVVKGENESLTPSNFAHFTDSSLQRLIRCWVSEGNGYAGPLSNSEWRQLLQADFYVSITGRSHFNAEGMPSGERPMPQGPDVLTLRVDDEQRDVTAAIAAIVKFFQEANEG